MEKFYFQTSRFLVLCSVFLRLILHKTFCQIGVVGTGGSNLWNGERSDSSWEMGKESFGLDNLKWCTHIQVNAQWLGRQVFYGVVTLEFSLRTKVLRIYRWSYFPYCAYIGLCSISWPWAHPYWPVALHFYYFLGKSTTTSGNYCLCNFAWWPHQRNLLCLHNRELFGACILKIILWFVTPQSMIICHSILDTYAMVWNHSSPCEVSEGVYRTVSNFILLKI